MGLVAPTWCTMRWIFLWFFATCTKSVNELSVFQFLPPSKVMPNDMMCKTKEEEEKENELWKMYSITVRQMFKAECGTMWKSDVGRGVRHQHVIMTEVNFAVPHKRETSRVSMPRHWLSCRHGKMLLTSLAPSVGLPLTFCTAHTASQVLPCIWPSLSVYTIQKTSLRPFLHSLLQSHSQMHCQT